MSKRYRYDRGSGALLPAKPTGEHCKACGAPLTAAEAEAMAEALAPLRGEGCESWEWQEQAAWSHGCNPRGCDDSTLASEG